MADTNPSYLHKQVQLRRCDKLLDDSEALLNMANVEIARARETSIFRPFKRMDYIREANRLLDRHDRILREIYTLQEEVRASR